MKRKTPLYSLILVAVFVLLQGCGNKDVEPEQKEQPGYLKNMLKREIFSRTDGVAAQYFYTNNNNVAQLQKINWEAGGVVKKDITYEYVQTPGEKSFSAYTQLTTGLGATRPNTFSNVAGFVYSGGLLTGFRTTEVYPVTEYSIKTYDFTYVK